LTVTLTVLGSDLQTETGSVVTRSRIDVCPLVDVCYECQLIQPVYPNAFFEILFSSRFLLVK